MTNQTENFPDLMSDDSFEVVMRGYSRRQVHDYMVRTRNQIRDLEERLARTIDQAEQSRVELAEARRKLTEAPQNPDELGERLSQILKLAHEEAAANKEASQSDANRMREQAMNEAERLVATSREQADSIRAAAKEEAERRVADATISAERLLSQAGADAEETLGAARAEAEDTLREARAEADRRRTAAKLESEKWIADSRAEAETTLAAAQMRVAALDEHTGRRVSYLTETHTEVMRRLNEIGSVLGDLLHREAASGPLIDEAAVLPPPPQLALPAPAVAGAEAAQPAGPAASGAEGDPQNTANGTNATNATNAVSAASSPEGTSGNSGAPANPEPGNPADRMGADHMSQVTQVTRVVARGQRAAGNVNEEIDEGEEHVRVIVDAGAGDQRTVREVPDEDTDVNLARVRNMSGEKG